MVYITLEWLDSGVLPRPSHIDYLGNKFLEYNSKSLKLIFHHLSTVLWSSSSSSCADELPGFKRAELDTTMKKMTSSLAFEYNITHNFSNESKICKSEYLEICAWFFITYYYISRFNFKSKLTHLVID